MQSKLLLVGPLAFTIANATPTTPRTTGLPPTVPGGPQAHVEGDEATSVPEDRIIRTVDYDLCWPANDKEYAALGKNAVLMITATSMFPQELPISSAYIESDGATVPLRRIALLDLQTPKATEGSKRVHSSQVAFYLLPVQLTKKDARLLVDFTGERKGFSVADLSNVAHNPKLPKAVQFDERDAPGKPDTTALQTLLVREYPDYFPERPNLDARAPSP